MLSFSDWIITEEIHGNRLIFYHRTPSLQNVKSIQKTGFKIGAGAAYGPGIYGALTEADAEGFRSHGPYLIKSALPSKFVLIIDIEMAKKAHGANYRLKDQFKDMGFRLDPSEERALKDYQETLEGDRGEINQKALEHIMGDLQASWARFFQIPAVIYPWGSGGPFFIVVHENRLVVPISYKKDGESKWVSLLGARTGEYMTQAAKGRDFGASVRKFTPSGEVEVESPSKLISDLLDVLGFGKVGGDYSRMKHLEPKIQLALTHLHKNLGKKMVSSDKDFIGGGDKSHYGGGFNFNVHATTSDVQTIDITFNNLLSGLVRYYKTQKSDEIPWLEPFLLEDRVSHYPAIEYAYWIKKAPWPQLEKQLNSDEQKKYQKYMSELRKEGPGGLSWAHIDSLPDW